MELGCYCLLQYHLLYTNFYNNTYHILLIGCDFFCIFHLTLLLFIECTGISQHNSSVIMVKKGQNYISLKAKQLLEDLYISSDINRIQFWNSNARNILISSLLWLLQFHILVTKPCKASFMLLYWTYKLNYLPFLLYILTIFIAIVVLSLLGS